MVEQLTNVCSNGGNAMYFYIVKKIPCREKKIKKPKMRKKNFGIKNPGAKIWETKIRKTEIRTATENINLKIQLCLHQDLINFVFIVATLLCVS